MSDYDIHIEAGRGMSPANALAALTGTASILEKGELAGKRKRLPHKMMRDIEQESRQAVEAYNRNISVAVNKYFEEKTALDNGVIAELPSMEF